MKSNFYPLMSSYVFIFKIRMNTYPSSHWVGTAQMGTIRERSVVDERLCVWGVQNLRVAGMFFHVIFSLDLIFNFMILRNIFI